MTIYIYGTKVFKDEINSLFEKTNLKFRLSDDDSIVEINSLDMLKNKIEENPDNIFLIDDEKIIKNDSLQEKLNFFKEKDRIEIEFLKKYGIGDNLNVDTFDDLSKYIAKRLEEEHEKKEYEVYNEEEYFLEECEIENLDYLDDDDLSGEEFGLVIEKIGKNKKGIKKVSSNITDIDNLDENDLLEALCGPNSSASPLTTNTQNNNKIELNSNNISDVSALLTQLLNNKTLEISIKIKE